MALGFKTGGRKKGSKNKQKAVGVVIDEAKVRAAESGITPLQYMLCVMNDPLADEKRRDDMAKAAAVYMHPKLVSNKVEVDKAPDNRSAAELRAEVMQELAALGIPVGVPQEEEPQGVANRTH